MRITFGLFFLIISLWHPTLLALDYEIDFELPATADGFEPSDWLSYKPTGVRYVAAPERASLDSTIAHDGKQSLRIFFPESSVGPSQGGHQAAILIKPETEYYLSYWLRFDKNFSWGGENQGGKLPGLAQGDLCSGGQVCDGTNGFTTRYMWRKNGAAVLYLYHMDKPHQWGEDFTLLDANKKPVYFEPDTWIHLVQRVKVNTDENADGEVQVWVNGVEALNLKGLRLLTGGRKIDTFYVSTFHGGNTPDWGPLNDSYLWIDDIKISTSKLPDAAEDPPNIIFFIADDMYPDMFNNLPEGKDKNLTPNIDRLAHEGSYLSNLYVASPVCTPSRYNVLTGNYASRARNEAFTEFTKKNEGQTAIQWNAFITPGLEKTIGSYLQEMGYKTGFVGKNHVVESKLQVDQSKKPDLNADPNDPDVKQLLMARHTDLQKQIMDSGFDYADNLYHDNPNWLGISALAYQNMDWITEGGLRFIDTYKDDPFFLYFATTLPHQPTDPEHSWQSDPRITPIGILNEAPKVQPARETIPDRIKQAGLNGSLRENLLWVDDALGALFTKLESTGEIDNTIIFFFNDHGQNSKGTLYQGGIRSQAFVWSSKQFKCGSACDAPVSNIDFLPTILELAGRKTPIDEVDGYSFAPALNGQNYTARESMYFELGFARAVVKDDFKYLAIRYPEYARKLSLDERQKLLDEYNTMRESFGGKAISHDATLPFGHLEMFPGGGGAENATYGKKPGFFDADQLYDLGNDPDEHVNLANNPDYQPKLWELKSELKTYLDRLPGKFD